MKFNITPMARCGTNGFLTTKCNPNDFEKVALLSGITSEASDVTLRQNAGLGELALSLASHYIYIILFKALLPK